MRTARLMRQTFSGRQSACREPDRRGGLRVQGTYRRTGHACMLHRWTHAPSYRFAVHNVQFQRESTSFSFPARAQTHDLSLAAPFQHERMTIVYACLRQSRCCLEDSVAHVQRREVFGQKVGREERPCSRAGELAGLLTAKPSNVHCQLIENAVVRNKVGANALSDLSEHAKRPNGLLMKAWPDFFGIRSRTWPAKLKRCKAGPSLSYTSRTA